MGGAEILDIILADALTSVNNQTICNVTPERISSLKEDGRAIEAILRRPANITINQEIDTYTVELMEDFNTTYPVYRVVGNVTSVLYALEDNRGEELEGMRLVGSGGESSGGYECWIYTDSNGNLDNYWIEWIQRYM